MEKGSSKKGSLYVVGTPIGNLKDISLRALEVLEKVDLILCEDTRKTKNLLTHYKIKNSLESYYKDIEQKKNAKIIQDLLEGKEIAIVSSAGTPAISDPGSQLVAAAVLAGIPVVPIPGPCALIAALVVSGLDTSSFCFEGFLPKKSMAKEEKLRVLFEETRTVVLYESPNRIISTLKMMAGIYQDRKIVVVKELTKIFEQVLIGSAQELAELYEIGKLSLKGEFVLLIEGYKEDKQEPSSLKEEVRGVMKTFNISQKEAIALIAKKYKIPKKNVYKSTLS